MADYREAFVGIDVAKLRNAIAIADSGREGESRQCIAVLQDGVIVTRTVFGLTTRGKPAFDRPHANANPWRDLSRRQAGLPQVKDFGIELGALVAARPAQTIKLRRSLYRRVGLGVFVSGHLCNHGISGGADRLAMASDRQAQRFLGSGGDASDRRPALLRELRDGRHRHKRRHDRAR